MLIIPSSLCDAHHIPILVPSKLNAGTLLQPSKPHRLLSIFIIPFSLCLLQYIGFFNSLKLKFALVLHSGLLHNLLDLDFSIYL